MNEPSEIVTDLTNGLLFLGSLANPRRTRYVDLEADLTDLADAS